MKVSGFTFIRNAVKYDYPVVESISSILSLCDEFVIAVGNSEDETLQLIKSISSPKIKIIETVWNDSKREGGHVLADETNKAFDALSPDSDWCVYIQGDECVHEKDIPVIRRAMASYLHNPEVEGLLFNYHHFYGSYDFLGASRRWYRKEIRIIRNNKRIRSYKDAQGFRMDGRKLNVKPVEATIYHYGWVRHPATMKAKDVNFNRMYHDDNWIKTNKKPEITEFDYAEIDSLKRFKGVHPEVMKKRIEAMNWTFSFDPTKKKFHAKNRLSDFIEKLTGWRMFEYKNYRIS